MLLFISNNPAQTLHKVLSFVFLKSFLFEVDPEVLILRLVVNTDNYPLKHLISHRFLILNIYFPKTLDIEVVSKLNPIRTISLKLSIKPTNLFLNFLLIVIPINLLLIPGNLNIQVLDLRIQLTHRYMYIVYSLLTSSPVLLHLPDDLG